MNRVIDTAMLMNTPLFVNDHTNILGFDHGCFERNICAPAAIEQGFSV